MFAVSSNQIAPTVLLFNPSRGDNLERLGMYRILWVELSINITFRCYSNISHLLASCYHSSSSRIQLRRVSRSAVRCIVYCVLRSWFQHRYLAVNTIIYLAGTNNYLPSTAYFDNSGSVLTLKFSGPFLDGERLLLRFNASLFVAQNDTRLSFSIGDQASGSHWYSTLLINDFVCSGLVSVTWLRFRYELLRWPLQLSRELHH